MGDSGETVVVSCRGREPPTMGRGNAASDDDAERTSSMGTNQACCAFIVRRMECESTAWCKAADNITEEWEPRGEAAPSRWAGTAPEERTLAASMPPMAVACSVVVQAGSQTSSS
jgi:hypothetical protein